MGRIETENKKILRQAMDVFIEVDETKDKPQNLNPSNVLTTYLNNSRVTDAGFCITLMDFANGGFYNDGLAQPIQTNALGTGLKYGYMSSELCRADGTFEHPPSVSFTATNEWDVVSITLVDSKSNTKHEQVYPLYSQGVYTLTFNSFTPNERLHIAKISLGRTWIFDNSNLISFNAILRGANETLDKGEFALEGSELDFTARVGIDGDAYVDLFGGMEEHSEIAWSCGYKEDMSQMRVFYLEGAEYDSVNKTIKIRACDGTIAFLDNEYEGGYITSTYANVREDLYDELKGMITAQGITPVETGTIPTGTGSTETNIFIDKANIREHIAKATLLYKSDDFEFQYRDAGNPEIIASGETALWSINEEDVSEFTTNIEKVVREYDAVLFTSTESAETEVASINEAVAGQTYIVSVSDPVASVTTEGATLLTPYSIKYVATYDGSVSIEGTYIVNSTVPADNPKAVIDTDKKGIAVDLGTLPKINYENGSLTETSMQELLESSNLTYTFKWRGNPHIKPLDRINMARISTNLLVPSELLLPSDSLVPIYGVSMLLLISSVSYEFSQGGLVSEITARKVGIV